MLSGQLERNLRRLNKNIRIFCGNDDRMAAGIFMVTPGGEYVEICGIDKNYVPEHIIWNQDGSIAKGGWRRMLRILISKGLIKYHEAERVFNTRLSYRRQKKEFLKRDEHVRKLESLGVQIIEKGTF